MKLPDFNNLVREYKKQVVAAIMGTVQIDEASFSDHNATLTATKVKLEEYASPQLLFSIDVDNTNKCYGFSIQCLCKDEDGAVIDAPDTFIDLGRGSLNGLQYGTLYLPDELEQIETIEVSLTRPIYENEDNQKGVS